MNYALASIDPSVSRELRRGMQPDDWAKADRWLQTWHNNWESSSSNQSEETMNGTGLWNFTLRNSETMGNLAVQALAGMASGGLSTAFAKAGAYGAAQATKLTAMALVNSIGTTYAVQQLVREGPIS